MTLTLAIIADDLTGALDAAAPFSAVPGGVAVATRPEALPQALAAAPAVVAVSTRSREIPADAARARVEQALAALPQDVRVVKKIDSRLKGNVAAELDAFGERPLAVLPAIPDFGRVVREGALQGFGVDVPIPVRSVLGRFADRADVPDTVEQDEMTDAVARAPSDAVFVGARGLSQALAQTMGIGAPELFPVLPRPVCFAVGSTDPITLHQADLLCAAVPDLVYLPAPAGRLSASGPRGAPVTLLQAISGKAAAPEAVARDFAEAAAPYLRATRSMLLTGGATAEVVLDVLDIPVLTVAGEAQPGMAACRAGGQLIVTKSGGFGARDAFVRLAAEAGAEV